MKANKQLVTTIKCKSPFQITSVLEAVHLLEQFLREEAHNSQWLQIRQKWRKDLNFVSSFKQLVDSLLPSSFKQEFRVSVNSTQIEQLSELEQSLKEDQFYGDWEHVKGYWRIVLESINKLKWSSVGIVSNLCEVLIVGSVKKKWSEANVSWLKDVDYVHFSPMSKDSVHFCVVENIKEFASMCLDEEKFQKYLKLASKQPEEILICNMIKILGNCIESKYFKDFTGWEKKCKLDWVKKVNVNALNLIQLCKCLIEFENQLDIIKFNQNWIFTRIGWKIELEAVSHGVFIMDQMQQYQLVTNSIKIDSQKQWYCGDYKQYVKNYQFENTNLGMLSVIQLELEFNS